MSYAKSEKGIHEGRGCVYDTYNLTRKKPPFRRMSLLICIKCYVKRNN